MGTSQEHVTKIFYEIICTTEMLIGYQGAFNWTTMYIKLNGEIKKENIESFGLRFVKWDQLWKFLISTFPRQCWG